MTKKQKFLKFSEQDEWSKELDQRKRYDKKKRAIQTARKRKAKERSSYFDQQ